MSPFRKFLTITLVAGCTIGASIPSAAHDMWMQARPGSDGQAPQIAFQIGHPGDAVPYRPAAHRLTTLNSRRALGAEGVVITDLQADWRADGVLELSASDAARLIVFETTSAFSNLDAERFDAYAVKEGLSNIVSARADLKTPGPGTELYSRRAKMLLGKNPGPALLAPTGQTLEIVALSDPTQAGPAQFQVLYRGAPLPGATIGLHNLNLGVDDVIKTVVDANGKVELDLIPGLWMLNTVWATELPDGAIADADWQTVFSSLSFRVAGTTGDGR